MDVRGSRKSLYCDGKCSSSCQRVNSNKIKQSVVKFKEHINGISHSIVNSSSNYKDLMKIKQAQVPKTNC